MQRDSNRLQLILLVFSILFLCSNFAIGVLLFPDPFHNIALVKFFLATNVVFFLSIFSIMKIIRKTVFVPLIELLNRLQHFQTSPEMELDRDNNDSQFFQSIQELYTNVDHVFLRLNKNLKELEESKDYIETLMRTVQVAIIVFNKSLNPVYINDTGREILGIDSDDVNDLKISDYIGIRNLTELFEQFQSQDTLLNQEIPIVLKDGRRLDVDISVSPLYSTTNELLGHIAVLADITQRKKAEMNLRNQINFSRQIFKAIPDMVVIVDQKLKIIFVNQKAEELMGKWTPDVKDITHYLSKRSLSEGFDADLTQAIKEGKDLKRINVLNPFIECDNYVDLAIQPVITGKNILGALILVRDITEWRMLTRRIEHLQGFTVKLIEISPVGFISIDDSFKINVWNQSAQKIFGITVAQAQGEVLFDICPSLRQYRGAIRNAMESDMPVYLTEQIISLDQDNYKVINLRFYQVKNDSNSIVINVEDVTEVKELEDSLLQAQKMEALGMLTSGIIHDFNNVLSGILGYASLLDKSVPEDSEQKRCTRNILVSSDRASSMIRQILDFAKKRGSQCEHVDINEVIRETLGFLGLSLKNISLEIDLSPEPLFINVNRAKISQILINLLVNARNALVETEKPAIIIKSENQHIPKHPTLPPGEYIIISISDNGSGIKKDHLQKIFEPFFTTRKKEKGTGIGLSTVKEIVSDYNGTIEVESGYMEGTIFTILLPLENYSGEAETLQKYEEETLDVKGMALLVDDEEVIRQIAGDMLKKLSINCVAANSGEEGIELFRQYKDNISFIILDIELPGIKGKQVYDTLKTIDPEAKILLTSGYGQEYLENHIFLRRITHFMPKPFQLDHLNEKLLHLLRH